MLNLQQWVFLHPVRTDLIVVTAVIGSIMYLLRGQRIRRRRLHRLIRGMSMKRKNIRAYQALQFEDALFDAALTMLSSGAMTDDQWEYWRSQIFVKRFQLDGFVKATNAKKGIVARLKLRWGLNPWHNVAGGLPIVTPDPKYKPMENVPHKLSSKYRAE